MLCMGGRSQKAVVYFLRIAPGQHSFLAVLYQNRHIVEGPSLIHAAAEQNIPYTGHTVSPLSSHSRQRGGNRLFQPPIPAAGGYTRQGHAAVAAIERIAGVKVNSAVLQPESPASQRSVTPFGVAVMRTIGLATHRHPLGHVRFIRIIQISTRHHVKPLFRLRHVVFRGFGTTGICRLFAPLCRLGPAPAKGQTNCRQEKYHCPTLHKKSPPSVAALHKIAKSSTIDFNCKHSVF